MKASSVKLFFFLVAMTFCACQVEKPDGLIEPDKMEALLYDYHLAQAITADEPHQGYKKKLHINYVFEKHNITKEEFDSSLVWYTRYPRRLARIYVGLENRLMAEMEAMGVGTAEEDAFRKLMKTADTVNLWRASRVKLLSSAAMANRLVFNFNADSTYVRGDSISFSFVARHLSAGEAVGFGAHAALVVKYADESTAAAGVDVVDDGRYAVAVKRNSNSDIKSLHGFLYYSDGDSLAAPKLLVGDIAVKRIHPLREE